MKHKLNLFIVFINILAGCFTISGNVIPMYISFGITCLIEIIMGYNIKYGFFITIQSIICYSIMLPDNYTIIFISFILGIYYILLNIIRKKVNIKLILILIYLLLSTIVLKVCINNLLFFIIFDFTFILYYFVLKKEQLNALLMGKISNTISIIIIIEFFITILKVIIDFNGVKNNLGSDWSIGTFGFSQGNILMLFCVFAFFVFFSNYSILKNKKDLILMIMSLSVALSTASIANDIVFFIAIVVYLLISNTNMNKKISLVFVITFFIILFNFISASWVKDDITALTNIDYFQQRVTKVETYKNTFLDIPKNDIAFFLIGSGMGQYSSRSALICMGNYVDLYDKYFNKSISKYTEEYIYPIFEKNKTDNLGVEDEPYSSIISIMGEFGIVGIFMLVAFFIKLLNSGKDVSKLIIIFFFGMLFIDNWLEYAKIAYIFWLSFFYSNYNYKIRERRINNG